MSWNRWQLAGGALVAAAVVVGKTYYRDASPSELGWLLSPIAHAVGAISGAAFVFDPSRGWVSDERRFVIAPACAGLNFALAAFAALGVGWLGRVRTAGAMLARIALAAVVALAATIVVDSARITLALWTRADGDAHQALGVAVYLGALCALCWVCVRGDRRRDHATA